MSEELVRRWRGLTVPVSTAAPRSSGLAWWGMLLAIATEAALFASLIAAYFYLRWYAKAGWPPDGIEDPSIWRPALMTGILVATALPAFGAQRAAAGGRRGLLCWCLGLTLLGGLAFIGLQAWDMSENAKLFTPKTNAYGSLFYTLTGAHAFHLIVGLVIGVWVFGRALAGAYGPQRRLGISVFALYWYFVIVLGIVVFLTVVISPYV